MLANDSTIASIVSQPQANQMEMKMCIERYINDLKKEEVNIRPPMDVRNAMLLQKAYEFARQYYRNLFGMTNGSGTTQTG